jgi:hypothetical protein
MRMLRSWFLGVGGVSKMRSGADATRWKGGLR